MPISWSGLDEQTFNALSKNLLKHLRRRSNRSLDALTLSDLREAMAQAMNHPSLHAARRAWNSSAAATYAAPSAPPTDSPGLHLGADEPPSGGQEPRARRAPPTRNEPSAHAAVRDEQNPTYINRPPVPALWREAMEAADISPQALVAWAGAHG